MLKSVIASEQQIYPISRQIYEEVRKDYNNEDYSRYTIADMGWVGFMASYNGRFFDGGFSGTCGKRNYIDESIRNLLQQVDNLRNVEFHCCSYESLPIPDGSIVYLDPPYIEIQNNINLVLVLIMNISITGQRNYQNITTGFLLVNIGCLHSLRKYGVWRFLVTLILKRIKELKTFFTI